MAKFTTGQNNRRSEVGAGDMTLLLTPRQKKFCEEYVQDHNASQAMIRAGYPPVSAKAQSTSVIKGDVKLYIEYLETDESKVTAVASKSDVVGMLWSFVKDDKMPGMARVRALELIGRQQGMFIDNLRVGGANGGPVEMKSTLLGLMAAVGKAAGATSEFAPNDVASPRAIEDAEDETEGIKLSIAGKDLQTAIDPVQQRRGFTKGNKFGTAHHAEQKQKREEELARHRERERESMLG
jgi:phage terminase small subunit